MSHFKHYYHASPRRFRYGDILTPGIHHDGGYRASGEGHDQVCLTTSPVPHATILDRAVEEDWYVYEVEPLEDMRHQRPNGNHELQCGSAKVIKLVGNARKLARGRKIGSVVPGRRASVIDSTGLRLGYKRKWANEVLLRRYIKSVLTS